MFQWLGQCFIHLRMSIGQLDSIVCASLIEASNLFVPRWSHPFQNSWPKNLSSSQVGQHQAKKRTKVKPSTRFGSEKNLPLTWFGSIWITHHPHIRQKKSTNRSPNFHRFPPRCLGIPPAPCYAARPWPSLAIPQAKTRANTHHRMTSDHRSTYNP